MRTLRSAVAAGAVVAASLLAAGPAAAHVTIPEPGEQGGFSLVTLRVPNERDDASTVTLEVQLPTDHPLGLVRVQPKPGWTVEVTTRTLDEPVVVFGEERTEVVDTVTWTGGEIGVDQFDDFTLQVGPLPDDVDELVFPAIQTYSSGEEVAWIEPPVEGTEEPEHPAPVLALVAPADGGPTPTTEVAVDAEAASDGGDDGGTDGVAVAALVVGIAAALLGGAAWVSGRRRV